MKNEFEGDRMCGGCSHVEVLVLFKYLSHRSLYSTELDGESILKRSWVVLTARTLGTQQHQYHDVEPKCTDSELTKCRSYIPTSVPADARHGPRRRGTAAALELGTSMSLCASHHVLRVKEPHVAAHHAMHVAF